MSGRFDYLIGSVTARFSGTSKSMNASLRGWILAIRVLASFRMDNLPESAARCENSLRMLVI